jgi:hypothetical protein
MANNTYLDSSCKRRREARMKRFLTNARGDNASRPAS